MSRGNYIVLEGIDGCGKSTQAKMLMEKLFREGYMVHQTAEPTEGPVGKLLRRILSGNLKVDKRVMGMLFVPDTLDHFLGADGLVEMVKDGFVVVSDRSYFSTMAYQSAYLPLEWIIMAHSLSMNLMKPDLVLFIDVDPDVCIQRLKERGKQLQIHEKLEFLKGVRRRYNTVLGRFCADIDIEPVNGEGTPEQVFEQVWELVMDVIT